MIFSPNEKQNLVELCKKNNTAAWHKPIQSFSRLIYKKMHKTLLKYGINKKLKADIDDIFQNIFIKIFRSIRQLRNPLSLEKSFVQITFTVTPDYIRNFLKTTNNLGEIVAGPYKNLKSTIALHKISYDNSIISF